MQTIGKLSVVCGLAVLLSAVSATGRAAGGNGGPGRPGAAMGPGAGPGMGPGLGHGPGGGLGPHGGGMGMMMHPEWIEGVAAELGVSAQAAAQIKTLVYNANKEAIDLKAELERGHLDLKQLMDQDKPDTKKIMQLLDQVGATETKLRKNRVQLLLSVRELLTPDQRAKLQGMMAERRRGPGGDRDDASR